MPSLSSECKEADLDLPGSLETHGSELTATFMILEERELDLPRPSTTSKCIHNKSISIFFVFNSSATASYQCPSGLSRKNECTCSTGQTWPKENEKLLSQLLIGNRGYSPVGKAWTMIEKVNGWSLVDINMPIHETHGDRPAAKLLSTEFLAVSTTKV